MRLVESDLAAERIDFTPSATPAIMSCLLFVFSFDGVYSRYVKSILVKGKQLRLLRNLRNPTLLLSKIFELVI